MRNQHRRECFCALCRSPRKLRYSRELKAHQIAQILVLTIGVTAVTYPWLAWRGVVSLPIIWAFFEIIRKSLYRKDLICPTCGFDPAWYKKDVKIARQKVEEFLKQNPENAFVKKVRTEEISKTSTR